MTAAQQNYNFQKIVAVTGVLLFVIKLVAWYITSSVAILTDALESTVNVASAFIGLYSLYISAKPKDSHHPYGHGKVEFISAGLEGGMITIAGLLIIYEAIKNLIEGGKSIGQLDYGIILVSITALVNFLVGAFAIKQGKANKSLALVASGKHLQSDTYTTLGIIVGLVILYFTGMVWLDSVVALIFALLIIVSGFHIVRDSIKGIMDEADDVLLKNIIDLLQANRSSEWIDLHNLRLVKYGSTLHLDCHLTVPWYFNVREAHREIEKLKRLVNTQFGNSVDFSVHTDDCRDYSCALCMKEQCNVRLAPFKKSMEWTVDNVSSNHNHSLLPQK